MIGFHRPSDRIHAEAVQALNALDFRHYWIRDYLLLLLLTAGETRVKCAREVMETFATNLPFEYEEEKANPDIIAELAKEGKFNAEFAKPENLKTAPHADDDLREVVYMDNPLAREPEVKEMLAAGIEHQQVHLLWFWADKSLTGMELAANTDPRQAIERAKKLDVGNLFNAEGGRDEDDLSIRRGAVAGVAAVVLKYRSQFQSDDTHWAKDVTVRAARVPEEASKMWISNAEIPWHPGISAARALGFHIRAREIGCAAEEQLLRLVAHPLERVALVAMEVCFGLWDLDPRLGWCALWEIARPLPNLH